MGSKSGNLVSVIIPCYNMGKWISEAVESCLNQTYRPIEIIVIDDGSTDNSLDIIKSFGRRIRFESGANHGGNYCRNRGFALSKGEFIQFLDADDYLLPQKIEHQVNFLETSGAAVVYGDWRHQYHDPDGSYYLDKIKCPGLQSDVLESLLANWWVANMALLFRKEVIFKSGGWDERLRVGQDRDFFLSVAMTGFDIKYQPGCFSIYRRYGNLSISTSNELRLLESHVQLLEKAEQRLSGAGLIRLKYRRALAESYYTLARNYRTIDINQYERLLKKAVMLLPNSGATKYSIYYSLYQSFGTSVAESAAHIAKMVRLLVSRKQAHHY